MKNIFKRPVYTPPDLSPTFTCIKSKLVEHKKSGLISYFGPPSVDRGMQRVKFLAATEDYHVLHKIIFWAVQLSTVSPTEWLERL